MKFTVTTILSVMTIGLVTLCGLKPAQAQIRVACVGDSITYGVNLASNQTYPADLQTLAGSGYNVQNFGYPGLSLMSLPGGNPSYHPAYTSTAQYTSAINFNPNIVIIMLGANDASFAPNSGQTWAQTYGSMFASQYESLVAAFKNCPAHPVVYVALCTRIAGSNQYGIDPTVSEQRDRARAVHDRLGGRRPGHQRVRGVQPACQRLPGQCPSHGDARSSHREHRLFLASAIQLGAADVAFGADRRDRDGPAPAPFKWRGPRRAGG